MGSGCPPRPENVEAQLLPLLQSGSSQTLSDRFICLEKLKIGSLEAKALMVRSQNGC